MVIWSPPPLPLLCLLLRLQTSFSFSLKNCTVDADHGPANVSVDCSVRQLLTIPDDLPRDTTTLKLGYNLLTQVKRKELEGLTNLKVLDFTSNTIVHVEGGSFVHMGSLKRLQLCRNQLTELTENLFQGLSELTDLDLSSNHIHFIHASTFHFLPSLQKLFLDSNHLKEVSDLQPLLSLPNLKYLKTGSNLFTSFQSEDLLLEQPSSLTTLDVSSSRFEAFSISAATFPHLEALDLSSCVFKWEITDRSSPENLTQLYFSETLVSLQQVQVLLQSAASLEHLKMTYINGWIHQGLLATVCNISSLRTLELYYNKVENLSAQLESCSQLLHLDLSWSEASEVPAGSLQLMTQLKLLNLEVNFLTKVPEDIRSLSSLQVLKLNHNLISEVGCEDFSNTSALVELRLSSNRISSLHQCIFRRMVSLQTLDLEDNLLWTVEGVFSLGPAGLRSLDLSRNLVTVYDDASFQGLGGLTHLDVSSDKVGRVTAGAFLGLSRLRNLHVSIPLDYECDFRGLEQLDTLTISMTTDPSRSPPRRSPALFHLTSVRSLQVSCQGFHHGFPLDVPLDILRSMSNLEEFTADNIYISAPDPDTFASNSRLRTLKISRADLSDLDPELFGPIPELQSLDLSETRISSLDFLLRVNLSSLRKLTLCDNAISVVNHTLFRFLPALTVLDLSNNPLTCECVNAGFILWARSSSRTQVLNGHQYSCSFPVAEQGTKLLDLDIRLCWMDINFLCFLSTTCLLVVMLVSSFTYHFLRWQLLYAFHLLLAFVYDSRNRKRRPHGYDAFVSYNVKDELWVYEEMLPALEEQQGWKLCLHHRDFQPGRSSPGRAAEPRPPGPEEERLFLFHFLSHTIS